MSERRFNKLVEQMRPFLVGNDQAPDDVKELHLKFAQGGLTQIVVPNSRPIYLQKVSMDKN